MHSLIVFIFLLCIYLLHALPVDPNTSVSSDDTKIAVRNSLIYISTMLASRLFLPAAVFGTFLSSMIPIGPKTLSPDAMYAAIKQKIQVQIDSTVANVVSDDYAQKISTTISVLGVNLNGVVDAVTTKSDPTQPLLLLQSNIEATLPNWFRFSGNTDVSSRFVLCTPLNINEDPKSCVHVERGEFKNTQNLLADSKDTSIDSLNSMLFTMESNKMEFVKPDGGKMCIGFDKKGVSQDRFLSIRDTCPISFTLSQTDDQLWEFNPNMTEYLSFHPMDVKPIFCVGKGKPVLVTTHGRGANQCKGSSLLATRFKYRIPVPVDSKDKSNILSFAVLDTLMRNLPLLAYYHLITLKALRLNGVKTDSTFRAWVKEYKNSIDMFLPVYETYLNYTRGIVDPNTSVPRATHVLDLIQFRSDLDKATMDIDMSALQQMVYPIRPAPSPAPAVSRPRPHVPSEGFVSGNPKNRQNFPAILTTDPSSKPFYRTNNSTKNYPPTSKQEHVKDSSQGTKQGPPSTKQGHVPDSARQGTPTKQGQVKDNSKGQPKVQVKGPGRPSSTTSRQGQIKDSPKQSQTSKQGRVHDLVKDTPNQGKQGQTKDQIIKDTPNQGQTRPSQPSLKPSHDREALTREGNMWKQKLLNDNAFFNHLGSWLKQHGYAR